MSTVFISTILKDWKETQAELEIITAIDNNPEMDYAKKLGMYEKAEELRNKQRELIKNYCLLFEQYQGKI